MRNVKVKQVAEATSTSAKIIRNLTISQRTATNARKDKADALELLRQERIKTIDANRELKYAKQDAVVQLLNSNSMSWIRSSILPTRGEARWNPNVSQVEKQWLDAGIKLTEAIREMTQAKEDLLISYRQGATINVNLDLDIEKLSKLLG